MQYYTLQIDTPPQLLERLKGIKLIIAKYNFGRPPEMAWLTVPVSMFSLYLNWSSEPAVYISLPQTPGFLGPVGVQQAIKAVPGGVYQYDQAGFRQIGTQGTDNMCIVQNFSQSYIVTGLYQNSNVHSAPESAISLWPGGYTGIPFQENMVYVGMSYTAIAYGTAIPPGTPMTAFDLNQSGGSLRLRLNEQSSFVVV